MYWWQGTDIDHVLPFDYPEERLCNAKELIRRNGARFEKVVSEIIRKSRSFDQCIRLICEFVQQAFLHNPIFQPAQSGRLYRLLRRRNISIPDSWSHRIWGQMLFGLTLLNDADMLLELGEARCGQCAHVLGLAYEKAGFRSKVLQFPAHMVTEVYLDGTAFIVDADLFKNGIFLEMNDRLATSREVIENPYLVDRFKHTGLMFRRDSVYAFNGRTGRPYSGYLDLHSPEIDGQISRKYGAQSVLYPPGIPKWKLKDDKILLKTNEAAVLEFVSAYPERASGYRVVCGTRSRGYRYNNLARENLANETSSDIFCRDIGECGLEVSFSMPGSYYLSAAAVPHYINETPSYVWWSDELHIQVVR